MGKTTFNKKMTTLLNSNIDDVDIARIRSIIGDKKYTYALIDEQWIEDQYIGDGLEYRHEKFGTVTISVELSILDIIGNNVLIENKRTYVGKYSEETNVIIMYFFGPIEEEVLKNLIKGVQENEDSDESND